MLRCLLVTMKEYQSEVRTTTHRRRGGEPDCSVWKAVGKPAQQSLEINLDELGRLPYLENYLQKANPNHFVSIITLGARRMQCRYCILRELHFTWCEPITEDEACTLIKCKEFRVNLNNEKDDKTKTTCGSISFLLNQNCVVTPSGDTSFSIEPPKDGWSEPLTFNGAKFRVITFDCSRPPDNVNEYITVEFDPGALGMDADWPTGMVKKVVPGGVARAKKVRAGWLIHKVDGEPYEEFLLDRKRSGRVSYKITFDTTGARFNPKQVRDEWVASIRQHVAFAAQVVASMSNPELMKASYAGRKWTLMDTWRWTGGKVPTFPNPFGSTGMASW